jgi:hypothetical protein
MTASRWVERSGRIGFAAKGVIYLIVGGLAAAAAFGLGGRTTGSEGALTELLDQPLGTALLAALALGLAAYSVWRLVQAAADVDGKGSDAKGLTVRLGQALSGAAHGALAVQAARLAAGARPGGGDEAETWTRRLLGVPLGVWLVGAIGAGIVVVALVQIRNALVKDPERHLELGGVGPDARRWIVRVGRYGAVARSFVFALAGVFLVHAAVAYDPSEAGGLGDVLAAIARHPLSPWLLAVVSLGLVAFGCFELVNARYRRVTPRRPLLAGGLGAVAPRRARRL